MTRLRLRWTKVGKVRFTSHRDSARIWERALRRSGLPVARTEGFTPRPKLHFGLALPTGCESQAEYLDVDLRAEPAAGEGVCPDLEALPALLPALLSALLPLGIDCVAAAEVDPREPSLQQAVGCCTWQMDVEADLAAVSRAVAGCLAAPSLPLERQRKGRAFTDDLRPSIEALTVSGPDGRGGTTLVTDLATATRAVRPNELLAVIDPAWSARRVVRLHQWITPAGAPREEPLAPGATQAPHAWERAS